MSIKLMEVEPLISLLEPILKSKCKGLLSLEIIDVLDELEDQLKKLDKAKTTMIESYAEKKEDGTYKVKLNDQGLEIHEFGENEETVNKELDVILNQEIELENSISTQHLDNNIEIQPINLKVLIDKKIFVK